MPLLMWICALEDTTYEGEISCYLLCVELCSLRSVVQISGFQNTKTVHNKHLK